VCGGGDGCANTNDVDRDGSGGECSGDSVGGIGGNSGEGDGCTVVE